MTKTAEIGLVDAIAPAEYLHRQQRLLADLDRLGFDGALVWGRGSTNADGCADLLYLTGHMSAVSHILDSAAHSARGHAGLVVARDRPTVLVTDSYDADPSTIPADEVRLSTAVDRDLAVAAREAGFAGRRIALIGMSGLLHAHYLSLAQGLGGQTQLVAADDVLIRLRLVKSEPEIALLREASRIGCEWVMRTLEAAVPGATEGDAVGEGLKYLAGAGGWAYDVAVSSGPSSHRYRSRQALPTWDSQRRLEAGDLFHADAWGPIAHGYFCDLTRSTVVGGQCTRSQARTLNDAVDLVEHVTEILQPGTAMSALQDRAAQWLARRDGGAGSNFAAMIPFVGHSLGLECEAPFMTRLEHTAIEAGMVLAVECFLGGEPGQGAGFEHVVVVREDRLEVLTQAAPSRPW